MLTKLEKSKSPLSRFNPPSVARSVLNDRLLESAESDGTELCAGSAGGWTIVAVGLGVALDVDPDGGDGVNP